MKTKKKLSGEIPTNLSNLKTHLSQFIRSVKGGHEVIVYDRQIAVAKIVPYTGNETGFFATEPVKTWEQVVKTFTENNRSRKPSKLRKNSSFYLNEDRGSS